MNKEYIKTKIRKCIDEFYLNESDLLKRKNYEVTISSKFAQYLFMEFSEFDVDCEYNKHLNAEKEVRINGKKKAIRPDIVIHRRGTDKNNLVYIEIKTDHNTQSREDDYNKIKAMTKQSGKYKYQLGVFIDFNSNKNNLVIKSFEDEKECN